MNIRKISLALAPLMLAGCGSSGELSPPEGKSLPPAAYGQEKQQTADALIKPSVQTRPGRSDELLLRSEKREIDPFDLPPGAGNEDKKSAENTESANDKE